MTEKEYFLGIDTSNYKTSIAVVDGFGKIIADERKFLTVKKGERGIRQSEALFQHINNLPVLLESLTNYLEIKNQIKAVSKFFKTKYLVLIQAKQNRRSKIIKVIVGIWQPGD